MISNKKRSRKFSSEEQQLEESVFGAVFTSNATSKQSKKKEDEDEESISLEVDRIGDKSKKSKVSTSVAAWNDDDDDEMEINLKKTDRLKKLQKPDKDGKMRNEDSKISG